MPPKNIIPVVLLAAMVATPAMAACEAPPIAADAVRKNPYLLSESLRMVAACRQAEADKAAKQEREDIHAIRLALEEIAQGLRIRQPKMEEAK
jgi:hypothetical protein